MAHKITVNDITDQKAKEISARDTDVDKWLVETDLEFDVVCQQEDVEDYSSASAELRTTMHTTTKRYLISYLCMIIFRDKIGAGIPDIPTADIYDFKYKQYAELCAKLRPLINYEILTNADNDLEPEDMIGGGIIWPG